MLIFNFELVSILNSGNIQNLRRIFWINEIYIKVEKDFWLVDFLSLEIQT